MNQQSLSSNPSHPKRCFYVGWKSPRLLSDERFSPYFNRKNTVLVLVLLLACGISKASEGDLNLNFGGKITLEKPTVGPDFAEEFDVTDVINQPYRDWDTKTKLQIAENLKTLENEWKKNQKGMDELLKKIGELDKKIREAKTDGEKKELNKERREKAKDLEKRVEDREAIRKKISEQKAAEELRKKGWTNLENAKKGRMDPQQQATDAAARQRELAKLAKDVLGENHPFVKELERTAEQLDRLASNADGLDKEALQKRLDVAVDSRGRIDSNGKWTEDFKNDFREKLQSGGKLDANELKDLRAFNSSLGSQKEIFNGRSPNSADYQPLDAEPLISKSQIADLTTSPDGPASRSPAAIVGPLPTEEEPTPFTRLPEVPDSPSPTAAGPDAGASPAAPTGPISPRSADVKLIEDMTADELLTEYRNLRGKSLDYRTAIFNALRDKGISP